MSYLNFKAKTNIKICYLISNFVIKYFSIIVHNLETLCKIAKRMRTIFTVNKL